MSGKFAVDAWTTYWHANRLDSCISSGAVQENNARNEADVYACWAAFLDQMPDGAAILDLATGNGAVSIRLAKAAKDKGKHLSLDAVDLANVDPAKYLTGNEEFVARINFLGGVDIADLSFKNNHFDGAVSQFGFEYAETSRAAKEMLRLLKQGGRFQLLVHHVDSALVAPNVAQIHEIDLLLASGGVVENAQAFLSAAASEQASKILVLEQSGEQLSRFYNGALPRITGEIFTAIEQLVDRRDLSFLLRQNAASDMHARLGAERERMRQLGEAALDKKGVLLLEQILIQEGARNVKAMEFRVGLDGSLLGWHVSGHK